MVNEVAKHVWLFAEAVATVLAFIPALDHCRCHETRDLVGELKFWLKMCNYSVNKASFASGQVREGLLNRKSF